MKLKVKINFLTIVLLASLLLSGSKFSIAALFAAALHELGHILSAKLCGIGFSELTLNIFGAGLTPNVALNSYTQEAMVCFAGPLVNLLSYLITSLFTLPATSFFENFGLASLTLGVLNLLPIIDFDGGRIASALLFRFFSPYFSTKLMKAVSFICIFALWSFSLYLIMRVAASLSLFLFSAMLFAKIFLPCDN